MFAKITLAATLVSALVLPAFADDPVQNPLVPGETWDYLSDDVVGDGPITLSDNILSLDAPYRAHDAATVPVLLKQRDDGTTIKSATVVVDENPAPVAGTFTFSDAMAPLDFELRVRVDQYSNVRVIADTSDGLYMTGRFVKASGGCSAPASGDAALALASMGQMKLRSFEPEIKMSGQRREAQIMIRHPNYSGLQRDQITQLFIPAHFLDTIEVWQDDELLFTMEGGISISENPVFRFFYRDNGALNLTIKATDTEGNTFQEILPKDAAT